MEANKSEGYRLASIPTNNIPFDDRVNHVAELADLNITLIQSYLKEIGSSLYEDSKTMDFVELCKSMNIIGTLPEYIKPKNVGLMFFSFEPDRFFPYAQVDVVEFPDDLGGNKIIENIFKGPLHIQMKNALLYIRNNIIQEMVIKLPKVAEARRFFNYPYEAIEESLANAVYHKGYNEREPIEVRVLPDRIEIVSHPGADRSVSIEGLQNFRVFSRRYRNRRIGEFLKELHLTEGRNTGFRKIISALEHNGSPLPVFETDEDRLSFSVTIYRHSETIKAFSNDKDPAGMGNGLFFSGTRE
jgi:ATP-dependent DNA helicase RecG